MKTQKALKGLTVPQLLTKLEKEAFRNGQRNAAWFKDAVARLQDRLKKRNATFASQFGERISKLAHTQ